MAQKEPFQRFLDALQQKIEQAGHNDFFKIFRTHGSARVNTHEITPGQTYRRFQTQIEVTAADHGFQVNPRTSDKPHLEVNADAGTRTIFINHIPLRRE